MKLHVAITSLILIRVSCGDEFQEKIDQFKASAEALRSCVVEEGKLLSDKYEKNLKIEDKEITSIQEKIVRMRGAYSIYYPGDVVYIMPVVGKIQSSASDELLSECIYSQIQAEAMHLNRVALHGDFDKNEVRSIIWKRTKLLLSTFPISGSVDRESSSLVNILSLYASFDEELTKEILLKNVEGLEKLARLPILVFMSKLGDEKSTKLLSQYDKVKVDRLLVLCSAAKREKIKTPEK